MKKVEEVKINELDAVNGGYFSVDPNCSAGILVGVLITGRAERDFRKSNGIPLN